MKRTRVCVAMGVMSLIATLSLAGQQADSGQGQSNLANLFSSPIKVPRLVRLSGVLKDLTGKPLSGPVEISFAIYKEQADAAPLWQETQTLALDEQGRYTVLLGAMQGEGLPMELFASGEAHWLGIQASGAEAQPRVLLVSVPYALKAGDAETLAGKPVSDFVLAQQLKEQVQTEVAQQAKKQPDRGQQASAMVLSQGPTPMVTSQGQTSFTCPSGTSGDCVTVTQSSTGRALYAVANSSAEALRVTQSGTGYGLLATSSASGVYGVSTATTGTVFGIRGDSASTGGRGILGFATATTGGTIGLWGNAASTGGTGLLGDATAATGTTYGLRGRSYSSSGTGILAYAVATTGTTKGLWAEVYSAAGTAAVFQNTASGKLLSGLTGAGTGTEVFSVAGNGNLVSTGSLAGASGNFSGGVTAASFTGNGAGLTNVNADLLDGRHASSFALVGSSNTFVGNQHITGGLLITGGIGLSGAINGGLSIQENAYSPNVVGGFQGWGGDNPEPGNSVTSGVVGATIGGGGAATAPNYVGDDYGVVGGGFVNQAGDGTGTTSDKAYATVGGGYINTASGGAATIGGGSSNTASGDYATVPGGHNNAAQGDDSFAAGSYAKANHQGAFVWGDSTFADIASTGTNQFIVRASGGVWFGTNPSSPSWPANSFIATSTGAYLSSGGTWTNSSDRNLKEQFAPVNGLALLARLAELPILTWNYRVEPASNRHIGPVAQDFRAAFGLGEDDQHISTVDADGVALTAIQALYKLSLEKDRQIADLTREVEELWARLARLEKGLGAND